jgi:hydroxyacylglutathione hydrolase
MDVHIIPILDDNYAYIIQSGDMVGVVDPGEAQPIVDFLNGRGLGLDWVISTHHHGDHVDGNDDLIAKYDSKLAAPAECGGAPDVTLKHGEPFTFGDVTFDVYETSGHTKGHVVLFDPIYRILFSGDTLFAMGCGRLFEGSAEDMFKSMQIIKSLPPETAIYCGHEYTSTNAAFSSQILPDNIDIKTRAINIIGQPCTMPTTLATELVTNPFLIAKTVGEFTEFRIKRNNFKQ